MTGIKQKVAGVGVLATVSVVSLLAGGFILGAASADEGNDTPTSGATKLFEGEATNVAVSLGADGEKSCFIAFGVGVPFDGAAGVFSTKPLNIEEVAGGKVEVGRVVEANGDVKTWKMIDGELVEGELPEGGLPKDGALFTKAIEAKPIPPEEIERLKAAGELQVITPEDCTVVNPEDMPEGFTPGKPAPADVIRSLKAN
jgi:hypothetical protein